MDESTRAQARAVLSAVPELAGVPATAMTLVAVGEHSNVNLRVDTPRGRFALRLARPDPGRYIDRASETAALRVAERLGLGAPLVHAEPATGSLLTRWIEGAGPVTAARLQAEPRLRRQAAELLGRLHGCGELSDKRFDVFMLLQQYAERRCEGGHGASPFSPRLHGAIERARAALAGSRLAPVLSHCDPVPENFLEAGARLFLIDWEYAGMNDPGWDLAYLSVEAGLDAAARADLLSAHGSRSVAPARVEVFRMLVAALGALWGLLRLESGIGPDLAAWSARRLADAERLARDPDLPGWLADLG